VFTVQERILIVENYIGNRGYKTTREEFETEIRTIHNMRLTASIQPSPSVAILKLQEQQQQ
jgi:hypothetical protein